MAYKKYIVKNGKVYGPYIYHSRRVNGKVISEYRGTNRKLNYKKYGFVGLGLLGLIVLVFLAVNFIEFDRTITGQAVLDLEADYQQNISLAGTLTLSLDEGELLPVSSKIIFKNSDKNYEYPLSDFISGSVQETETYPEVSFTLNIISSSEEETPEEPEPPVEPIEGVLEEAPEEITEEIPEEQPVEELGEETSEEPTEEVAQDLPEVEEPTTEEPVEEPAEEAGLAAVITNFFLSLNPTGQAVLEFEKQVSGKVQAAEEFTYNLEEGQTAEILSGSVRTETADLSDSDINLRLENNQAIVTTDYFEISGGQEYLDKELVIDLSELNLILEAGNLEVIVVYGDQEIVSLTTVLEEGQSVKEEAVSEVKEEEIQEEIIKEIIEENVTEEIKSFGALTDEEREILLNEFTDFSVEVTKSETINNRLIIRNEIGDFWVEYSYEVDSPNLETQIETDRIKWLKDIVKTLSQEKIESQEVTKFLGNFSD